MKTVKEVLEKSTEYFEQKQITSPRLQAEETLADALEMKRLDLYLQFDRPLNDEELDRCRNFIQKRAQGEPSQYTRGSVMFADCKIDVTPDVLIPRQETEILVSKIIEELDQELLEGKILWDVCCGSGCIGIALKKKFPLLQVYLSDISPEAIAVAKKNALQNRVEVTCLEGDLLHPFEGKKTDYVVCNPPYVTLDEYETLDREVRDYEPKLALVAGNDGLEFYQRLAQELPYQLNPQGKAWFEIGHNQGKAVSSLFSGQIKVEKDWAGHDRFVEFCVVGLV